MSGDRCPSCFRPWNHHTQVQRSRCEDDVAQAQRLVERLGAPPRRKPGPAKGQPRAQRPIASRRETKKVCPECRGFVVPWDGGLVRYVCPACHNYAVTPIEVDA